MPFTAKNLQAGDVYNGRTIRQIWNLSIMNKVVILDSSEIIVTFENNETLDSRTDILTRNGVQIFPEIKLDHLPEVTYK